MKAMMLLGCNKCGSMQQFERDEEPPLFCKGCGPEAVKENPLKKFYLIPAEWLEDDPPAETEITGG